MSLLVHSGTATDMITKTKLWINEISSKVDISPKFRVPVSPLIRPSTVTRYGVDVVAFSVPGPFARRREMAPAFPGTSWRTGGLLGCEGGVSRDVTLDANWDDVAKKMLGSVSHPLAEISGLWWWTSHGVKNGREYFKEESSCYCCCFFVCVCVSPCACVFNLKRLFLYIMNISYCTMHYALPIAC